MNLDAIVALINALAPLVAPAVLTVENVIGALKGAGAISDADAATADLQSLIVEALTAKAQADAAAAGDDPR
jgi:hypothetical protein